MKLFLDYQSRTPIYEQIKEQIIALVGSGVLKENEQLPSLRQLSAELSININTIKRAFSELESQGIIYSVAGKGIFISGNTNKSEIINKSLENVKSSLVQAKNMGATKEDIINLIKQIYEGA